MLILPLPRTDGKFELVVVLEDENIERIKRYDPAQFEMEKVTEDGERIGLARLTIAYASPADLLWIRELVERGKNGEALKFIARGWEYRPDLGDHDGKPVPLAKKAGE